MKKIFLILLTICLFLAGCNKTIYHWEFNYGYEEISQVKIVEIIDFASNYREETDLALAEGIYCRVIKEIDLSLAEEVYNDIKNIEMRRYFPSPTNPTGKCFLIIFDNGEYDIISQWESKHFIYWDEGLSSYISWLCCDESVINELINKYLNKK